VRVVMIRILAKGKDCAQRSAENGTFWRCVFGKHQHVCG